MNDRSKCIFFNILFCLFSFALCFSFKIDSYALVNYYFVREAGAPSISRDIYTFGEQKICLYKYGTNKLDICSLSSPLYYRNEYINDNNQSSIHDSSIGYSSTGSGVYRFNQLSPSINTIHFELVETNIPIFESLQDCYLFLSGSTDFNDSMELDSLRVTSWNVGNTLGYHYDFRYKVTTIWSDSDISYVVVRVKGPRKTDDFIGNASPYNFKFHGSDYVNQNGDVVQIIATPYNSSGYYGKSLYSSFVYNNLHPLTYIWRKLFKTNDYDNTIEIPYTDPSGNDVDITLPVDGVTNNYTYNIKYNPQTEEITNQYLVDNYYTLVVDYPEDLSGNETIINETQNYINEYYTTNNYYQTTKDVDVDFDFDFGDISSNDAQGFKTQFDGFFDGLGNFIGKLAKLLVGLAPWLSPAVAVWIVAGFGFLVALLVLLLVIKLVSFVRSLLPF